MTEQHKNFKTRRGLFRSRPIHAVQKRPFKGTVA